MKELICVGKPVPRVDASVKVTGDAVYGYDLSFPGMLCGKVLRSQYAHAKILNIDPSKASRLPGVRAVTIGKEVPYIYGHPLGLVDQPFLAIDKVRYRGEAVAAVAAVDEEIAEEALSLIKVEYEELPAVFDPIEAMNPDAPILHEEIHLYKHAFEFEPIKGTNICQHAKLRKGDIEQGFRESDFIFENTFKTQIVAHSCLEPHVAVAAVDVNSRITIWVPHDSPHACRSELAHALKIPLSQVRIIVPFMGGGFGSKGGLTIEPVAVALAMKTKGKPVKVAFTRSENFMSTLVRHPTIIQMKMGVKKDGTLWACQIKGVWDTGAYSEKGPRISSRGTYTGAGPYRIPHLHCDGYCVYTNNPISGAFRGFGVPQAAWAYESQMDIIAHKLGMDPLEIRLKNALGTGDLSPTGEVLKAVGLKECLQKAADEIDWSKRKESKGKMRGKGLACMYKYQGTHSSTAVLKVNEDGTINISAATVELGQGADTILSQIAAEELGVPIDSIRMNPRDTDFVPFDRGTIGSRSTFMMGNAVRKAAIDVREQFLDLASQTLETRREDLIMEGGEIFFRGSPEKRLTLGQLAMKALTSPQGQIIGRGSSTYPPETFNTETGQGWEIRVWMYAAQAAEVEVDTETGLVKVLKLTAAHDVGKVINPTLCSGQIEGALVFGLGGALWEEMLLKEGDAMNPNFHDYKLSSAMDIPELAPIMVEEPHGEGPYGAKGVGEPALAPTAPAIANAVFNAIGIRIKDLPLTPEKVLKALKEKKSEKNK